MKVSRGDIILADIKAEGSIQKNLRPYYIISNNKANYNSPVITAVALSARTGKKKYLPTHIQLPADKIQQFGNDFFLRDSIALCEMIVSIDYSQILDVIGRVDEDIMESITEGVKVQVGVYGKYN